MKKQILYWLIAIWSCGLVGITQAQFSASEWQSINAGGHVLSIDYSADGRYMAMATSQKYFIYNKNMQIVWQYTRSGSGAGGHVSLSPKGRYLAFGNYRSDGDIGILDIASQQIILTIKAHRHGVIGLAFTPDERYLASSDYSPVFKIWNIAGRSTSPVQTISRHKQYVLDLAFTADGQHLISSSEDNSLIIWGFNNGRCLEKQTIAPWGHDIYAIAISPDGKYLAAGGQHNAVKIWQMQSGRATFLQDLAITSFPIRDMAFSPDSKYLAALGSGKKVHVWGNRGNSFAQSATLEMPSAGLFAMNYAVDFSQDGNYLAAGGTASTMKVWSLNGVSGNVGPIAQEGPASGNLSRLDLLIGNDNNNNTPPETNRREVERVPPTVRITQPTDFLTTREKKIILKGTATDNAGVYEVLVDGEEVDLQRSGEFVAEVKLAIGSNTVRVKVVDKNGNITEKQLTIIRQERAQIVDVDINIPKGRTSRPNAVAVVIGNKNYNAQDIPAVEFAHRDAEIMKRYLVDALGYREVNIIYELDAGKSVFERVFGIASDHRGQLYNYIKEGESDVFVFYSGHGAPHVESGKTFFVPVDADPQTIHLNGYSVETMYTNLGKLPAKSVTVSVDACFSGFSERGSLIQNISPAMLVVENPVMTRDNMWVFSAAQNNQVSSWYAEMKHGLFTYFFLKGLQGSADSNNDRKITTGEMKSYLSENVPHLARRLNSREQHPQSMGQNPARELVSY